MGDDGRESIVMMNSGIERRGSVSQSHAVCDRTSVHMYVCIMNVCYAGHRRSGSVSGSGSEGGRQLAACLRWSGWIGWIGWIDGLDGRLGFLDL
jgi:hypothetical protein